MSLTNPDGSPRGHDIVIMEMLKQQLVPVVDDLPLTDEQKMALHEKLADIYLGMHAAFDVALNRVEERLKEKHEECIKTMIITMAIMVEHHDGEVEIERDTLRSFESGDRQAALVGSSVKGDRFRLRMQPIPDLENVADLMEYVAKLRAATEETLSEEAETSEEE